MSIELNGTTGITNASWTLNEDTCLWDCPVAYPDDGKRYTWDEGARQWNEEQA